MLNSNSQKIKTYVGTDGKLHFVNSAGADTALNFSSGSSTTKLLSINISCQVVGGGVYQYGSGVVTLSYDSNGNFVKLTGSTTFSWNGTAGTSTSYGAGTCSVTVKSTG